MRSKALQVAGIGEILFDILPGGKKMGGAPSNFVFHCKMLGLDAHLVSAVGEDMNGKEIRRMLSSAGISTVNVQSIPFPTGTVEVSLDSDGIAQYKIHEDVAWDHIAEDNGILKLASSVDAVCFGSLAQRSVQSYNSIHNFLKHTKEFCLRVFDINLRQNFYSREIIENSLQAANVLKLNDDELEVLRDLFELPELTEPALRMLLERYSLHFIAFTQGAAGSLMMDPNNISRCAGIPVVVKDTVGAGDSFTATMVMGILYELPLERINQLASQIAAYVCSQAGATPTLPSYLTSEYKRERPIPNCEAANVPSVPTKNTLDHRKANQFRISS
jgi:fructokinase